MIVKRVSSVFLVAFVLAACLAVPSSAGFAAGVSPNGRTIVEALVNDSIYDNTPSSGQYVITDGLGAFYDTQPIYLYRNGDRPRYGVSIYSYSDNNHAFYGGFISGDALNDLYGNNAHLSGYYYPIAFSRTRGSIGWTRFIDNGSNLYVYNPRVHNVDAGDVSLPLPYPLTGDASLYYKVLGSQQYSYEFLTAENENLDVYTSLFNSFDDLIVALVEYESGSESPDSPTYTEKYFSLLPGYAVAIQFQRGSVDLSYTAPSYAVRPGTIAYLGPQYYYSDAGLLPSTVSFSTSYAPSTSNYNNIPFSGVPPATIDNLTRSFKASFSYDVGHSQACLVLYNPLYVPTYANAGNFVTDGSNTSSDNRVSNSIAVHISAQSISRIRLYPLESSLHSSLADGQIVSSSSDPSQVIEDVSPDASGAPAWETGGEESYNPVIGGNTLPDELTDQGLFSFLTSLFEKFASIFTWGHEALITVFNSASGFIARLGSLYSWLPPEVISVISGCIILVLVIGLIKVLL